jgi:hypothetical protein
MSDTSILPTADSGSAAPGVPVPFFDDGPGDDRRRLMIIGGIVAGVLVLVVGFLLLHGGGSSDEATGAVPRGTPHPVTSPAQQPANGSGKAADSNSKAGTKLPKASNRRLAKDPFKPLVVDNTSTAKGGSSDSGTVSGSGTTNATPLNPGTVPPGTAVSIRFVKTVLDASGNRAAEFAVTYTSPHSVATFDVGPPVAGAASGTVFANVFALLGVQGDVVTIQVGDDTPFDLRKGASHSV